MGTSYATINGNGEQYAQAAHFGDNTYIKSGGFWDEHHPPEVIFHHVMESYGVWVRYEPGSQTSAVPTLNPIRTCGSRLQTFRVEGRPTDVRCLWEENNHNPAAWLGARSFNGKQYLHIGSAFLGALGTKWGASDVCLPGSYCGKVNLGNFTWTLHQPADSEGARSERATVARRASTSPEPGLKHGLVSKFSRPRPMKALGTR